MFVQTCSRKVRRFHNTALSFPNAYALSRKWETCKPATQQRRPINRISTRHKFYIMMLHLDTQDVSHKINKPLADMNYHSIYSDKCYHRRITITMQDIETGKRLVHTYYRRWHQSWNQTTVHTILLLTYLLFTFKCSHSPSLLCIHNLSLDHRYTQCEAVRHHLARAYHSVTV